MKFACELPFEMQFTTKCLATYKQGNRSRDAALANVYVRIRDPFFTISRMSRRLRCARLHEETTGANGKRPDFDIDLYAAVLACPRDLEIDEFHEYVNTSRKYPSITRRKPALFNCKILCGFLRVY